MKRILTYLLLFSFLFIVFSTSVFAQTEDINFEERTLKAKILEENTEEFEEGRIKYRQQLTVEIISDQHFGEIMEIENNIMRNSIYGEHLLDIGDRIILNVAMFNTLILAYAGTVGLIITIPLTAFSAAVLYNKFDSK